MRPTLKQIERAVNIRFGLVPGILHTDARGRDVARPRQIHMFLAKEMLGTGWKSLGRYWGKDHTTAMFAFRRITGLLQTDLYLARQVEGCRDVLARLQSCEAVETIYRQPIYQQISLPQ
jgi:chromosomal replication initiation ATPase DnaA